jgi:hypothetical protein
MQNRIVHLPGYLHELHGVNPNLLNLIATYMSGIIAGLLMVINTFNLGLPIWKTIILFILYADIESTVGLPGCYRLN